MQSYLIGQAENLTDPLRPDPGWNDCRFLTCSVLPVRYACNLACSFCFSKSSISSLTADTTDWRSVDLDRYFQFARERGATRFVITGGGEPLLRATDTLYLLKRSREYFDETACFTNGTFLTYDLAHQLADSGLSYLCYSRHHHDDERCRDLMGRTAPTLERFFEAAAPLTVRATCVMAEGYIDSRESVGMYMQTLAQFGVRQFTFKHTYVAYPRSVFANSDENQWARIHQVNFDPFRDLGVVLATLPWGPQVRQIGSYQCCYYHEPTPQWEREHQLCRSTNLLSDGTVYASLEDLSSRLFQLRL